MLVLFVKKLAPTHDIEDPVLRLEAMAGRVVEMAVWSRNEVNWTRANAGKTINSLLRGKTWD